MKRARFLTAARLELRAEIEYYSEAGTGLGIRFTAAVEAATSMALAFPLSGSLAAAGTRRIQLKDFPLSLVYRVEGDGILVVAVAPNARAPGYWRGRVKSR